jgi:hypothetical protein
VSRATPAQMWWPGPGVVLRNAPSLVGNTSHGPAFRAPPPQGGGARTSPGEFQ